MITAAPGRSSTAEVFAFSAALVRIVCAVRLDGRGFAAPSVARRLSAVRQFHRFLFAEGVRGDDPTGTVEGPRRAARLPKVMSEADAERLVQVKDGEIIYDGPMY